MSYYKSDSKDIAKLVFLVAVGISVIIFAIWIIVLNIYEEPIPDLVNIGYFISTLLLLAYVIINRITDKEEECICEREVCECKVTET